MVDSRALLGKPVAKFMNEGTRDKALEFARKHGRAPKLAVLCSPDASAQSYLKTIHLTAKKVSADVVESVMTAETGILQIQREISRFNEDDSVDGILIQEPLPRGATLEKVGLKVNQFKDVDGITPYQSGLLFRGSKHALVPPTARAVIEILDYYRYGLQGQEVVVLGRSLVVGKPVGILALSRNATVTWCHSKTQSLPAICKRAEVLIVAVGQARMIDSRYVRPGATVVDVGINVDSDGSLVGDVDAASVLSIATALTPVPGGVGPVTTACMFDNLLNAGELRYALKG